MAHIVKEVGYSENEDKLKNHLIKTYLNLELNDDYAIKQPLKFYKYIMGTFEKERYKNTLHSGTYIQSKEMHEVRKRFYKNFVDTKTDAKDFHKYFYNKFLDEIKIKRESMTGSKYSKKQDWEGKIK